MLELEGEKLEDITQKIARRLASRWQGGASNLDQVPYTPVIKTKSIVVKILYS